MDNMDSNNNDFNPVHLLFIILGTIIFVSIAGALLIFVGGATSSLLAEILIIVPAMIYVIARKMPIRKSFRLNGINMEILAGTLVLSLSLYIIGDELDRLIYKFFPMPDQLFESLKYLLQIHSFGEGFIIIFSGVVLAALTEEMLFRGALQRTLEKHRDPAIAIVLSSVVFAVIHFNPWSALQIMFLGLFLGYMAWKSDSIIPSMVLHGLNNLLSIVFINMPEDSLHWYATEEHVRLPWILVGLVLLVPAIRYFNSACHAKNTEI